MINESSRRAVGSATKFLAAGGIALAMATIGSMAGPGIAAADGHDVSNPDGTFGAADVANSYGYDWSQAVQAVHTATTPPGDNTPSASYPAAPQNLPSASYPADPSWPDNNWGVDDR